MAKLTDKATQIFRTPELYLGKACKVGNNRTMRVDGSSRVCGMLYRTVVFSKHTKRDGQRVVTFHTGGHLTTTTIAAMKDFMSAADIQGRVSRAGGKLTVTIGGVAHVDPDGECVEVTL